MLMLPGDPRGILEGLGGGEGDGEDEPFELALPSRVKPPAAGAPRSSEAQQQGALHETLPGRSEEEPSDELGSWGASSRRREAPEERRSGDSSDTLRLVTTRSRPPPAGPPDLAVDMHDRFALGDFSGALRAAELLLGQHPDDRDAHEVATASREQLEQFYLARLGGLAAIFAPGIEGADVRWLGLDHRAGFLLSRIDGATSIEELVDLSGMPRHEALRMLQELLASGAIKRAR